MAAALLGVGIAVLVAATLVASTQAQSSKPPQLTGFAVPSSPALGE